MTCKLFVEIRNLGYKRLILKSDQERSIKALKDAVKERMMDIELVLEESPVGEHQSNGEVENAVKRM